LRLVISISASAEHRTLGQIDAIGADEIQYSKGHKYLTLVYQIDLGVTRLLWIGKERMIESFQGFFTTMGEEITSKIVFICSDMWEPYLKVIREKCSGALHILDRFHIVAKMNKALDEIRAEETRRSRIEPMKKIARSLRQHRELILNYFRAQKLISSGVVEGLNNKAKVTMRKSYGFRPADSSDESNRKAGPHSDRLPLLFLLSKRQASMESSALGRP